MNDKKKPSEDVTNRHEKIRKDVQVKEARRNQPGNFADIFNLQNNDFGNQFNNQFNGETK